VRAAGGQESEIPAVALPIRVMNSRRLMERPYSRPPHPITSLGTGRLRVRYSTPNVRFGSFATRSSQQQVGPCRLCPDSNQIPHLAEMTLTHCGAEGFTVRAYAPVLAMCRKLIEAGYDPATPLHAMQHRLHAPCNARLDDDLCRAPYCVQQGRREVQSRRASPIAQFVEIYSAVSITCPSRC
jgi:hypothetical protein